MEYARFVALREEACEAFAADLTRARRGEKLSFRELEELAVRYRQILHDHALARSRYPGTAMARQLERLALEGTLWLQRDTGEHLPSFKSFLTVLFPRAMWRLRPVLGLTVALFPDVDAARHGAHRRRSVDGGGFCGAGGHRRPAAGGVVDGIGLFGDPRFGGVGGHRHEQHLSGSHRLGPGAWLWGSGGSTSCF